MLAAITDDVLYQEILSRAAFWDNSSFYGIDIQPAMEQARREYFSQPIVGWFSFLSEY